MASRPFNRSNTVLHNVLTESDTGGVETNGADHKCGSCGTDVVTECILCEGKCKKWFHFACVGLKKKEVQKITKTKDYVWTCKECQNGSFDQITRTLKDLRNQQDISEQEQICHWGDMNTIGSNLLYKLTLSAKGMHGVPFFPI